MSFLSLNLYLEDKTEFKDQGNLSETPFYVLLAKILDGKMSGRLLVSKGERIKHVYFDKGNPVSIKSNFIAESLDSIVLRMGLVSPERMRAVIHEVEKSEFLQNLEFEQKLFLYLKEKNYLSLEDLTSALRKQFLERLLNLFGWFAGDYSFERNSHIVYNLSRQAASLPEIYKEIECLLYPDRNETRFPKDIGHMEGNFKDTFFPSLMRTLIESGSTGKLVMQKKDRTKELRIHNGVPVEIISDHPSEQIGKIMSRTGIITNDDWLKLEDEAKFLKTGICELALQNDLITEKDAKIAKALLYAERYLELFGWRSGIFRFEKRRPVVCPNCSTQMQVKPDIDLTKYRCSKCNLKLPAPEKLLQKMKQTKARKKEEIVPEEFKPPKGVIRGSIPEEAVCPDCGSILDPVLKKCPSCSDETLLDHAGIYKEKDPVLPKEEVINEEVRLKTSQRSQFDILVSNVLTLAIEKRIKTIAFISPGKKSGNSFISLNTAVFLSENFGKKTLLVDANFLNPSLSFPLEVKPEYDLYDMLRKDIEPSKAIYETSYSNLFLLPLKSPSKDPDADYDGETFSNVFNFLKKSFDTIIFDMPSDIRSRTSRYFLEFSDGIVLVVRKGIETERRLKNLMKGFDNKKLIGTVFNRIN